MAIIKRAKNITIRIESKSVSYSGNLTKTAKRLNVESVNENLSLNSNKKIVAQGNK